MKNSPASGIEHRALALAVVLPETSEFVAVANGLTVASKGIGTMLSAIGKLPILS